jgi:trans-aconitate methyltransferase
MASVPEAPGFTAARYSDILGRFSHVMARENEYVRRLDPQEVGHPVRAFTSGTAMRPFLAQMTVAEEQGSTAAYDAALMPFRRVLFTVQR